MKLRRRTPSDKAMPARRGEADTSKHRPVAVEVAQQLIREAGLRATASRIAVYRHLKQAGRPISHAEVAEVLVDHGLDRAAIYRNLIDLSRVGLLRRIDAGDHVWRFEPRAELGRDAPHPHFVCDDCGTVACLPDVEVKITAKRGKARNRLLDRALSIRMSGTCDDCQ